MPRRSRKCRRHGYHEKRIDSSHSAWPNIDFAIRLVSFFTTSLALGGEALSCSPTRGVLEREGGKGSGYLTGQDEDKDQSPAKLTLARGLAVVGRGISPPKGYLVLLRVSSTIPLANSVERAYFGRDLLSCPALCYDSMLKVWYKIQGMWRIFLAFIGFGVPAWFLDPIINKCSDWQPQLSLPQQFLLPQLCRSAAIQTLTNYDFWLKILSATAGGKTINI